MSEKQAIGFTACGIMLFLFGAWKTVEAHSSASWSSVAGIVVNSSVETHSGNASRPRGGTSYAGGVTYQYTVDTKTYSNDVVRIGQLSTWSKSRAEETVRRHPVGATTVFYNSKSPQQSVLEPGIHADNFLVPIVGLMFSAVGLFLYRDRRKHRSASLWTRKDETADVTQ